MPPMKMYRIRWSLNCWHQHDGSSHDRQAAACLCGRSSGRHTAAAHPPPWGAWQPSWQPPQPSYAPASPSPCPPQPSSHLHRLPPRPQWSLLCQFQPWLQGLWAWPQALQVPLGQSSCWWRGLEAGPPRQQAPAEAACQLLCCHGGHGMPACFMGVICSAPAWP